MKRLSTLTSTLPDFKFVNFNDCMNYIKKTKLK